MRTSTKSSALPRPLPHDLVRTPSGGENEPIVGLEHVGPDDIVGNLTGVDVAFAMVRDDVGLFVD